MNSTEKIKTWMMSNYTSTPAQSHQLEIAVDKMLKLYEDNPALGSPYNTGNKTFGLGKEYKRYASIGKYELIQPSLHRLTSPYSGRPNDRLPASRVDASCQ
jgi:hypothetical protein